MHTGRFGTAALLIAAFAASSASAADDYLIDPCDSPIELRFEGFAPSIHRAEDICSGRDLAPMSSTPWDVAGLPQLSVRRDGTWVELNLIAPDRRELRLRMPIDGKARPFVATDGKPAPPWRASAHPAQSDLVAMRVINAPSDKVLADLARIEGFTVKSLAPMGATPISFQFQAIPVRSVVGLLAENSGLRARWERDGSYTLGKPRHARRFELLRERAHEQRMASDEAALDRTLEEIVRLGAREDGGDMPEYVGDEWHARVELAVSAEDFARAEKLARAQLEYLDAFEGAGDDAEHARALADLGYARWRQDDDGAARPLFEQALALLEKQPAGTIQPLRVALHARLSEIATDASDFATAEKHASSASALLDMPQDASVDEFDLYTAHVQAERGAMLLAMKLMEQQRPAQAQPHLERALHHGLEAANDGPGVLTDLQYGMLIQIARILQQPARLRRYARDALALAVRSGDEDSQAHALGYLTLAQVHIDEHAAALASWRELQELRRNKLGEDSVDYRNGQRALVLLLRRAGQGKEAAALHSRLRRAPPPVDVEPDIAPKLRRALSFDLLEELELDLQVPILRYRSDPALSKKALPLQQLLDQIYAARR